VEFLETQNKEFEESADWGESGWSRSSRFRRLKMILTRLHSPLPRRQSSHRLTIFADGDCVHGNMAGVAAASPAIQVPHREETKTE
jgi:hypothetical protein